MLHEGPDGDWTVAVPECVGKPMQTIESSKGPQAQKVSNYGIGL